ncbi:hypothetical protein DXI23_04680 [Marinobacter flavimaris]|uniref:Uncharacterized protein n=1 Tax=Marinobacter flavimaris TaxID=262076 RepID=A0A3D8H8H0_9GAMM|nr:hypothetical protein [Marinobacter flavimaris]PPI78390.1 hypothetical protein MDHKLMBL_20295 [Marinobacter flavimaris]RDU42957.1 hypothetical protein DXI23_04680 [Marinobacter flavimaris]
MKNKFFVLIAFALLMSGCVAPQNKPVDGSFVILKDMIRTMGVEFREAEPKEKASIIRLYSAFNTARHSPKYLYSSKLSEAKGLLLEYKASEAIGSEATTLFSQLAKYMSEPYTDRYLHKYVDYILKEINTKFG